MFRTTFDEENKLWCGPSYKMDWIQETSLGSKILKTLKSNGPKVAQICAVTGDTKTYEDLHRLTVRAAINLQKFGCKRGRKIFLFCDNLGDLPPLIFAAICLGCPLVPLVIKSSQSDCEYFINITKPEFAITQTAFHPMLKDCFKNVGINAKIFTIDGQTDDSISTEPFCEPVDNESNFEPEKMDIMSDVAFILQTSGTTGWNKGIPISHATILDKMESLNQVFKPTDVIIKPTNISSVSAIRCFLGATLYGGKRLVNTGVFTSEHFFYLVERFKATMTYLSIFRITRMIHDPSIETANLDSLTLVQYGDANASLKIIQKFSKYLKNASICNTYGLTESYGTISCNLEHTRNNCVGQLLNGHQAKIVDEHQQRLGVNEIGELRIKFSIPFSGYINKAHEMHLFVDEEGFFMTGDEARFDENGDLFVDDRLKEVFKSDGKKISPAHFEAIINNIEGVEQSCVVSVPAELVGYLAAAVVVKSRNSTCTEQSIFDSVFEHFGPNRRLDGGVYFINEFPFNSSGKITRFMVREMAIEFHKNSK